jgi:hypothetical protein
MGTIGEETVGGERGKGKLMGVSMIEIHFIDIYLYA